MNAKPLPFPAFVAFMKCYTRATMIVLDYSVFTPEFNYDDCSQNPAIWEKFKFLVKVLHVWLKASPERDWFGWEAWALEHVRLAERLWHDSGLRACPRMEQIRNHYTKVKY